MIRHPAKEAGQTVTPYISLEAQAHRGTPCLLHAKIQKTEIETRDNQRHPRWLREKPVDALR